MGRARVSTRGTCRYADTVKTTTVQLGLRCKSAGGEVVLAAGTVTQRVHFVISRVNEGMRLKIKTLPRSHVPERKSGSELSLNSSLAFLQNSQNPCAYFLASSQGAPGTPDPAPGMFMNVTVSGSVGPGLCFPRHQNLTLCFSLTPLPLSLFHFGDRPKRKQKINVVKAIDNM